MPPKRIPFVDEDICFNKWRCVLAKMQNVEWSTTRKSSTLDLKLDSPTTLSKTFACGSDANLFDMHTTTGGNTSLYMVAAGSYLSGGRGVLQKMSTTVHVVQSSIYHVLKAEEIPRNYSMDQISSNTTMKTHV
jgi:hypothetical protein